MAQSGMDQKLPDIDHYVIGYRVLPQADGQPDFTEVFSTLNKTVGDENWILLSYQPQFYTLPIGAETVYLMPIFVETSALNLLKFQDIFKNEIRVIEERLADKGDYEVILTNGKLAT